MSGEGDILGDITLTVLVHFAAFAQLLCARSEWREIRCVSLATLLRSAGWFVLSVRFMELLITAGDLPIGAASVLALAGLAMAEITAAALNQRK
jgi:hypothetical protein